MITISLCMIVKNEENCINNCLASVKDLVDEIVIVDTGSTDQTKKIVEKYTDKIYDFPWIDDFSAARNFAFSKANKDYILWLDADDILLDIDQNKFKELKHSLDPSVDVVNMNYHLSTNEKGDVSASLRRNRLVKSSNNFKWIGPVHEYLEVYGKIINSDIAITHSKIKHDSDRNLRIYENRLAQGEKFTPRDLYYYANELLDHQQIDRAIEFYKKFLDTGQGWIEDNIAACGKLADCYNNLKDEENELKYIFKSFEYDTPRAEFCCRLGFIFLQSNKIMQAIFWYKMATETPKPTDSWGLINHACWTWLPHLQLCICYDKIGNYKQAYRHNEKAAFYSPDNPNILHNRRYFEGILYNNN